MRRLKSVTDPLLPGRGHEPFKIYVAAVPFSIKSKPFFRFSSCSLQLRFQNTPKDQRELRRFATILPELVPVSHPLSSFFRLFFFSPIEGASKLSRLICRRRAVDSMKIRAISTVFVPINVLNFVDRETVIEESSGNSPPLDRFFQSVLSDGRTQSDHAWRLLLNTCARAGAVEWNNPRTGQTRRLKPVSAGYRFNGL